MANNGYLFGNTCFPNPVPLSSCPLGTTVVGIFSSDLGSNFYRYSCYIGSGDVLTFTKSVIIPLNPNCDISIPSSIPTVADGITLGWQAGAALILVGCILFLKKALK